MNIAYATSDTSAPMTTPPMTLTDNLMNFVPMVLILLIFYVVLMRPQMRRQREQQAMLAALKKGDRILTSGGIIGTVTGVEEGDAVLRLEVAEGVELRVVRAMVQEKLDLEGAKSKLLTDGAPKEPREPSKKKEKDGGAKKSVRRSDEASQGESS
jgi:preprotein translocase subunit YajC